MFALRNRRARRRAFSPHIPPLISVAVRLRLDSIQPAIHPVSPWRGRPRRRRRCQLSPLPHCLSVLVQSIPNRTEARS